MKNRKMYICLFPFLPIFFLAGCQSNQQGTNSPNRKKNGFSETVETSSNNKGSSSSSESSSSGQGKGGGKVTPPPGEEKSKSQDLLEFVENGDDETCTVSGFKKGVDENYENARKLVIPSKHKKLSVSAIAPKAFFGNSFIESVTLPSSIDTIGIHAFARMKRFTSFHVPANEYFKSIDGILYSYDNGNKVLSIFPSGRRVESFTFPSDVTGIGKFAFSHCSSLKAITIPKTISYIGYGAFVGCGSLENISVSEGNKKYRSIDGVVYSKKEDAEHRIVIYPSGRKAKEFVIPSSVRHIGNSAFAYDSYLRKITLPDKLDSIYEHAFQECTALESIIVPGSVTNIGREAFKGCLSLKTAEIASSSLTMKSKLFSGCKSLEEIRFTAIREEEKEEKAKNDDWNKDWSDGCNAKIIWEGKSK